MMQIEAEQRKPCPCPNVPRGLAHGAAKKKCSRTQKNPLQLYAEAEMLLDWRKLFSIFAQILDTVKV